MEIATSALPVAITLTWEQEQFLRDLHELYPDEENCSGNGVNLKENPASPTFGEKWTLPSE